MVVQDVASLTHSWSDRLKELGETVGAVLFILGIVARVGRVHVDRYISGWFRRNKTVARSHVHDLIGPELEPLRELPHSIDKLSRAMRGVARAQRQHTKSMSSFSDRIGRVELLAERLDERTSNVSPSKEP